MLRCLFVWTSVILLAFPLSASADINSAVENWLRLRNPAICYPFPQYSTFLNNYGDWPESGLIKTQAEQALADTNPNTGTVLAWFKRFPPQSDRGKFLYFQNLVLDGNGTQAKQFLQNEWVKGSFNGDQQDAIMTSYRSWLTADNHAKRLDALLWQGNTARAEKALNFVGGTHRAIGIARLKLQRFDSTSANALNTIPQSAMNDQGLIFDRVRFSRQRNQDDFAIRILKTRRDPVAPYNVMWWRERSLLARRALERKDFQTAYDLAASHGHLDGAELADAEWLAGWLAVSRLNKPGKALEHFDRMYRNVKTPISVARAAYWAGVAASKTAEHKQDATQWYRVAAYHMHTFYGQMAAYALGNYDASFAAFFKRQESLPSGLSSRSDLTQAATLLKQKGFERERDIFLGAILAVSKDKPYVVINQAKQLNSPKMVLAAAKTAYDNGHLYRDALFPRMNPPKNAKVETALTLGIIRQESMFDPYAKSPANAMGLMQLLPGTAAQMSRKYGIAHKNASQLFNPQHNMTLGQAYLATMLARYDGNIALTAASYNAGPGNVDKWIGQMGYPESDGRSWVDWAERIPFYETRNYVQRVWEAYQTYTYLLAH